MIQILRHTIHINILTPFPFCVIMLNNDVNKQCKVNNYQICTTSPYCGDGAAEGACPIQFINYLTIIQFPGIFL